MNDLLKKLNILIQAGINDVLDDAQKTLSQPLKSIPQQRIGKGIEQEVNFLREQINKALDYEDELTQRIETLRADIATLDRQADEALARKDEANARYLLDRMLRAKQRLTMTEADLNEHRIATQELIMKVNQLDATISEARHAEQAPKSAPPPAQERAPMPPQAPSVSQQPPQPTRLEAPPVQQPPAPPVQKPVVQQQAPKPASVSKPEQPAAPAAKPQPSAESQEVNAAMDAARTFREETGKILADVLRDARESVTRMNDLLDASHEVSQAARPVEEAIEQEFSAQVVEDELASRLARLSAPKPPAQKPTPSDSGE